MNGDGMKVDVRCWRLDGGEFVIGGIRFEVGRLRQDGSAQRRLLRIDNCLYLVSSIFLF
jgi:hypothetical protein